MRRRYVYDPEVGEMVEVGAHYVQPTAPTVFGDLPGYESPVSGKWIEGRKARREDLARTNCRPYEGLEQEKKEANKVRAQHERQLDQLAEKMAYKAWDMAPERVRKVFRSK